MKLNKITNYFLYLIFFLSTTFCSVVLAEDTTSVLPQQTASVEPVKDTDNQSADKSYFNGTDDSKLLKKDAKKKESASLANFRVYVDKSTITIGDKVTYTMELDADSSVKAEFPSYVSNLGGFVVKDFGSDDTKKFGKHRFITKHWYLLDTYTVGSYVIPAQTAYIILPDGNRRTLKSPEVFVQVKSVMSEDSKQGVEEGLRDIKPPAAIPVNAPFYVILLIIVFFIGTGCLAYWYFYNKKRRALTELPPLPADEEALLEFTNIEQMGLIEQGKVKEYYYLVSNTLRKYIERRFGLRAQEQTSEEFIEYIAGTNIIDEKYVNLLKDYLLHCDLVKYAKLEPEKSEARKIIETSRQFVNETREEPLPSAGIKIIEEPVKQIQ